MSFHLAGFYGSIGATANTPLTANNDGLMSIQNSRLTVPENMQVMAAYAQGALLTEARINIPTLRAFSLPRIHPVAASATRPSLSPVCGWNGYGPRLVRSEGITIEASNSGAGPTATHGLLWLAKRKAMMVGQEIITVKATAAIGCNVGVWTGGSMTLESELAAGSYQVVGMAAIGANLLAARLRFPGQDLMPGVAAVNTVAVIDDLQFRFGSMGVFGEFESYSLPTLECVGVGSNTAQIVYLDLVKVK